MAGLFDPVNDHELDFSGQPLDLPQPAKPGGSKWKDLAPLLAILPFALKQGGRVGGAALLQGFQQAQQRNAQNERQSQQDAQAQAYRQAQLSSLDASRNASEQNAEATRRQTFLSQFGTGLESLDSPEAVQAYLALQKQQAQTIGLDPASLDAMAPAPTVLQQRAAKKALAALEHQYGQKLMEIGPQFKHRVGNEELTFDELLSRAGQSRDPNYVAPPPEVKPAAKRLVTVPGPNGRPITRLATEEELTKGVETYRAPAPPSGNEKPLTQNQRANVVGTRRREWQRFANAVIQRQQAVAKVDAGVQALGRGNRNAATQAIIMAFNKLLDESSVVREGEYARSEQLVPLINRIEGGIQRMTQGGASMKDADLQALASEAKNIAQALQAVSDEAAKNLRGAIGAELDDYKIPQDRVFGGSRIGVDRAPETVTPSKTKIGRFEVEVGP